MIGGRIWAIISISLVLKPWNGWAYLETKYRERSEISGISLKGTFRGQEGLAKETTKV